MLKRKKKSAFAPKMITLSFFFKIIYWFYWFYFWLCWVFVAVCGLCLVVVSGGCSSLQCVGFSLSGLLLLQSMGSRHAGFSSCGTWAQQLWLAGSRAQASVIVTRGLSSRGLQAPELRSVAVAHGLSFSAACGIFPGQGSNPCPLHWQADPQPLCHQGCPITLSCP